MRSIAQRRRRLAIARAATWIELAVGAAAIPLAVFVWIAAPTYFVLYGDRDRLSIEAIGVLGVIVGFVLMVWIRLAEPESGAPPWRYRSGIGG